MTTMKLAIVTLGWLIGFYALCLLLVGSWSLLVGIAVVALASELIPMIVKGKELKPEST